MSSARRRTKKVGEQEGESMSPVQRACCGFLHRVIEPTDPV
jgi:hypothetical protein